MADESDIETSAEYFNSAEGTYIEEISNAHKWLSPIPVHTSHKSVFNSQMLDMLSLPKLTIDVFTGDPLTYKEFMTIFDEVVDSKPVDSHMKLTRLLQFTSDKAKDSIRHCALIGGSRGYEQARRILSSRFGNEYVISYNIIDTLKNGKAVSTAIEQQQLADDLAVAIEMLSELNMSSEIENQRCIIDIVQRCTTSVQYRWRNVALEQKQHIGTYPKYSDFVTFMRRVAADGMDPLYGDEAMKSRPSSTNCSCSNVSGDSCNVKSKLPSTEYLAPCVVCQRQHILFHCDSFKAMRPQARFEVVNDNKLCFLYLRSGRFAKDCRKQYTCAVLGCGKRHTKFIHVDNQHPTSIAPAVRDDSIRGSCNENRGHVSGEHYRGSVIQTLLKF